jgi:predicted acylesterase/phospholipase RssA
MHNLNDVENLVLSGGGMLGISYIGLFRYLEEQKIASKIKTIVGSSAGAIFGMLFILGYTPNEIYDKFKDMKFSEYVPITADSLLNLIRVKGVNSCSNIVQFFKDALLEKTGSENTTFKEFYMRYGITFKIGATNLTTSRFELLDHTNIPDIPLYLAIKASVAVPFVFEPVVIGECLYCDGGLCDNLPIDYVLETIDTNQNNITTISVDTKTDMENEKDINIKENKENKENTGIKENTEIKENTGIKEIKQIKDENKKPLKTLGIYLTNTQECITPENYLDSSIYQYLNAVLHASFLHPTLEKKAQENLKNYKIIIIEIPCDIMTFLKLHATRADLDNIIDIAYETITKECQISI